MAALRCSLLFFFLLVSTALAQNAVVLPLRKDANTSQFYTTFEMGSTRATINAVVDLSGQHLWFACENYTSATYAPILCDSAKCAAAKGLGCSDCNGPGPVRPGCTKNTCVASSSNPFAFFYNTNGFYEDTLSTKGGVELPEFIFACVSNDYVEGLAAGVAGMVGLRRFDTAFHRVVAEKMNLPDKFSICPPSSGLGKLIIGGGAPTKSDVSSLLKSTALMVDKPGSDQPFGESNLSEEYFIDVRSINVAGEALSVNSSYFVIDEEDSVGGTKISSVQNYTAMHTSIYKPLARAFDKAAADMGMKNVAAVKPFTACYSSESVRRTLEGLQVPAIDLVLPGKDMYWRISGANAMVEVGRNTLCLAFADAGFRPVAIVIGAHQLEENYLEFDVAASQLRFTSSLLLHNKSCSSI